LATIDMVVCAQGIGVALHSPILSDQQTSEAKAKANSRLLLIPRRNQP
jgi:hypothetical protein